MVQRTSVRTALRRSVCSAQAITDLDFGPEERGLEAGALAAFAQREREGAALPFTPFQTSFDTIRKYMECMVDPSVQVGVTGWA